MAKNTMGTFGMAGGIIALAAIAAYFGLAHGCEKSGVSRIAGRVTILPELAGQLKATDVLFVIVRRPQTKRPLAAKRFDNPQFPVVYEITNADLMVQGTELRGVVDVVARLDRDGQAGPAQPGDIEGEFERNPTMVGGDHVDMTLKDVR